MLIENWKNVPTAAMLQNIMLITFRYPPAILL